MKRTYQNPLMEGADPFVLLYKDKYYLYATNAEDGFRVFVSDDLVSWEDKGYCLQKGGVIGEGGFWAPEVLERNGTFYMVYVADEHLAVATANSPLGPFRQREKKWLSERKAIDGHFFIDEDGAAYLYYVRLEDGNVLYMSKMDDSLTAIDEENERFLLRAEAEWERKDCDVVEGPFVLKHNGKYYLTYAANHTRSPYYAVGYAVSESPYGPFTRYAGNPVLHQNEFVSGVGHHSFTRSRDGEELICVYHSHYSKEQFTPRMVCVDRAEFVPAAGGTDALIIHGPTVTEQPAFGAGE